MPQNTNDCEACHQALAEAALALETAQSLLDQYGSAPLIPATFLAFTENRYGRMAVVAASSGHRAVALGQGIEQGQLQIGAPVFLSADQSILVALAERERGHGGELATFDRVLSANRLVIKTQGDTSVVVDAAAELTVSDLRSGDLVRWDRTAHLCLEKLETPRSSYLFETVEDIPLASIGGQDESYCHLRDALLSTLLHPERARRYGLPNSNSLLLYGPPGCGKTYLSKAVMSELQKRSGKRVTFASVKASALESPWVGQTQANISQLFASLREAASGDGIATLFIDEIDAIGRVRGSSQAGHHSDKFLGTFLTELNGFQTLKNVSIIAATNRKDILDPALLSRFAEEIPIKRPSLEAARQILGIYLEESVPYCPNGTLAKHTRQEVIEGSVSRLYAPNADNKVCTLKLRDGRTRTVVARELISSRLLCQLAHGVKRRGLLRELNGGTIGVSVLDMEEAVAEALERLSTTLTPQNAHNHLEDLSEGEVVLAVEPLQRRALRPLRFITPQERAA